MNSQGPIDRRDRAVAYRILDANLNRCGEGLRVIEEYFRFAVEDAQLTAAAKGLRHDLAELMGQLDKDHLQLMRNVPGDVGTEIATASEYRRTDTSCVAEANMQRVLQSLRSMEEYAKVLAPELAAGLERLRYRSYSLQRCCASLRAGRARLGSAQLYVLVDGRSSSAEFHKLVAVLLDSGVDILQLRDKTLSDRQLLERARVMRELTRQSGALFVMNDRADLALAAEADGVHLGQDELPVAVVRAMLGPEAVIGVSTHAIEQARQAVSEGANYIGCGPTFPSATKAFDQFPGLEFLRQVSREIALPAFAIGGVGPHNLPEVLRTGIARVAVAHAIVNDRQPAEAVRTIAALLRGDAG